MQFLTWWTRRARVLGSLDAILHAHNRQSMETHQMSLDLNNLRAAQARLTGAIESLVAVVSAQNAKIAALTAASSSPDDQAAVDAATADIVAAADKAAAAAAPTAPAGP